MSERLNRMSERLGPWTYGPRHGILESMKVVALAPRLRDARIARALDAMKQDPARPWTVAELARVAGVSRATFARQFARVVGEAPLRHLTRLRMDRAAFELRTGDEKLASIAVQVGYTSEFAFAKAFKRAFAIPPGRFRERFRATTFRAAA